MEWKLVPVEPTPEMVAAGTAADLVGDAEGRAGLSIAPSNAEDWGACDEDGNPGVLYRPGIWESMLAAAPKTDYYGRLRSAASALEVVMDDINASLPPERGEVMHFKVGVSRDPDGKHSVVVWFGAAPPDATLNLTEIPADTTRP